jgi:hypothetical protein
MPRPTDYTDDMGYGSRLPRGHAARHDNRGAVAPADTGPGFGPEARKGYLTLEEAKGANGKPRRNAAPPAKRSARSKAPARTTRTTRSY